jgi:hypothetical protein
VKILHLELIRTFFKIALAIAIAIAYIVTSLMKVLNLYLQKETHNLGIILK